MQPPAITRHRRPFLAPFWVMWLLFFGVVALAVLAYRAATTTTVVVVRHAEKVDATINDPPLAAAGERRAERLAQIFGEVKGPGRLDAIYVSDTRRAQQTAAALASRLGIRPTVLPALDVEGVVRRVLREHRGGRVIVVGHSNTVPEIVHDLSGASIPSIDEDEYDDLYVVTVPTVGRPSLLSMKY